MNTGYPVNNELAVLSALKVNLSAVKCPPIPFVVVIPVITPVYPSTFSTAVTLSVRFCGCCVITCGGLVNVYPKPIVSIETDDTCLIKKSNNSTSIIILDENLSYYKTITQKLHWASSLNDNNKLWE